ncbi:MSHA biogenesis protein MshK [Alkalimonas delamerensis]|uniref:MSHA biogenesis protein MshK n=1 Tax=Alkalimonas delamerensis TaxID=265981 RepID=A0ABT9GPX8_9GAMM|nr:MSHA biogenesis protein MshK [Alkalimonas delamerensis]MDP4529022.1 MSHA biogenesis protein MshK [Alkalimonas delamerensis]
MQILFSCSLALLLSVAAQADPTRPAVVVGDVASVRQETGQPVLQLIRWRDEGAVSMINGSLLKVGDSIDGYRVHHIARDHVVLERAGEQLHLFLFQKMTNNDD